MSPQTIEDEVSLELPFEPASAKVARSQLVSWLAGLGVAADRVEDARLVISELVGNAVRHARPLDPGVMLVGWRERDDGLELEVSDGGAPTVPRQRNADADAVGGRGLSIVAALSERWWIESAASKNTVHARLPLPRRT